MKRVVIVFACCLAAAAIAVAQGQTGPAGGQGTGQGAAMGPGQRQGAAPPANLIEEVQRQYTSVSTNAVNAADRFPEDKYKWQPTPMPEVRTWAQLVAHMTDDANGNCWMLAGLSAAPPRVESGPTATPPPNEKSKADLVAGFRTAVDVCKKAFTTLTPANMLEPSGGRGGSSKIGQLITITTHANEHYGNMVLYYRMAGMVPPSTADRGRGRGL